MEGSQHPGEAIIPPNLRIAGARYINYCPEGWSYYKLSCFRYFRQLLSWDEAEPVWVGLRYGRESQTWQWASGHKYNVASGLARNGAYGGTCGVLTHLSDVTLWSSADCAQQHHYICKFTPSH
nr:PREDICTED: regenerating islet-derived protein 4 [Pelecanus crispus]